MNPGIYPNMPEPEYRAAPGLNFSRLKLMAHSPAAFRFRQVHDTEAMKIGRLAHCALLEPARFARDYIVADGPINKITGRPYGSDTKAFAAWEAEQGKPVVPTALEAIFAAMRESIAADTEAAGLLAKGDAETAIFWIDPDTGLLLKSRIDWISGLALADLKTTVDGTSPAFCRAAEKMYYHVQAAMQIDGLKVITGKTYGPYHLIAVEKTEPYVCQTYHYGRGAIACGRARYAGWLAQYKDCEASGIWPGGSGTSKKMKLSDRAYTGISIEPEYEEEW